jgi:hypothetical protein
VRRYLSRWVNPAGKISLAGFTHSADATFAGEPVEVVVAGGLVDILHAGVVVATPPSGSATTSPGYRNLTQQRPSWDRSRKLTELADGVGAAGPIR